MKFNDFKQYFSESRINRYLISVNNSKPMSIKLYISNLRIAQSFHPILGVFEVVFRNRINDILTIYFRDSDWIINQKSGFMADSSLIYTFKKTGHQKINDFLRREIVKSEKRLKKSKKPITSGKIIADQSLGFWTDLFEVYHYRLLKGTPIQVFRFLPSGHGRKEVNDELNRIRRFRNRINHNEPICFKANLIDYSDALEVYKSLTNLLNWIDPEIIKFISEIDKVKKTIDKAIFSHNKLQ